MSLTCLHVNHSDSNYCETHYWLPLIDWTQLLFFMDPCIYVGAWASSLSGLSFFFLFLKKTNKKKNQLWFRATLTWKQTAACMASAAYRHICIHPTIAISCTFFLALTAARWRPLISSGQNAEKENLRYTQSHAENHHPLWGHWTKTPEIDTDYTFWTMCLRSTIVRPLFKGIRAVCTVYFAQPVFK